MNQATGAISPARVRALVGDFDRSPAYAGLAEHLTLAIGDGRIPLGARLPSERALTEALGVSRTTVTRAYAHLRDTGYAQARHGSGTYAQVPHGRRRAHDRALLPGPDDGDALDLNCAAASAPPGLAAAFAEAAGELPAYLGGHGYFPAGMPLLQAAVADTYTARGLATDAEQIMVTPGALSAAAIVARAVLGTGDRLLVEVPTYPNAVQALRSTGARLRTVAVDPDGWDLGAVAAGVGAARATAAYLIPDFQNPTGLLMNDGDRERLARELRRAGTIPIVDEAHQALRLDDGSDGPMPAPFARYAPDTITLGSASKTFWGGLRLGWIRAPHRLMPRLTQARLGLDLGAPVMEQLVLARLLTDTDLGASVITEHRARLRVQRDALTAAMSEHLPDWRYRVPSGGLSLWCRLPSERSTALAAEAEARGVIVAPGPAFAPEGGLDRFVRLPWTRPADDLRRAVDVLAEAWDVVRDRRGEPTSGTRRVIVA